MIRVERHSESFVRVFAEREIQAEIKDFFTFKAPGYRFHPKYKAKLWDGNISMYNMQTCMLPGGLTRLLNHYAESTQTPIDFVESKQFSSFEEDDISREDVQSFADSLNLSDGNGNPIAPKDYQIDAVHHALRRRRICLSMPTGSGKSLTIYIIMRWMLARDLRVCLIVPSISLTKQMLSDFIEYSTLSGFDCDEIATLLYSGQERNFEPPLLISTWQTISKMIKKTHGVSVINSYDAIIVDEAHTAKGTELQKILQMATDVSYRIGTTGTVDKEKVNELTIIGNLGPVEKIVTTAELIESGDLSGLLIKSMIMQYPEEIRKTNKALDYVGEIDFICNHSFRTRAIASIGLSSPGTTLILCSRIEAHLLPIYEYIAAKAEKYGKEVFMIHGGIDPDERERIRKYAIANPGIILVCSYQTCQQGVNIPNIENVVFAGPSKSMIRVLQSIGRGIRRSNGKCMMTLYDFVDDMRYKKYTNTLFTHFLERMKIYRSEKFDVEMVEVSVK